ncbi:MAG: hypothetical protein Q7J35_08710 [Candidatus Methanoperedens sp.]|nr:hypothetical protein [Candidatus Methanoperedens sp.]
MQEENSAVIIDSDFLSSFLKIGKLALIKDFFKVEKLYIPVAVFSEISRTKLVKHVLDVKYLQIETIEEKSIENFDRDFDNLGNGEKECIALCKKFKKSMFLTSDKKAIIKDLKIKDYYEFSDDMRKRLL